VWSLLERRKGLLDGVCISGGEPTLAPFLPEFLRQVKDKGFKVKLDTNGYHPQALTELVEGKLLDFIAMDIKNSPARYGETVGLGFVDLSRIKESSRIIKESGLEYEFRTTVAQEFIDDKAIEEIIEFVGAGKRYALQPVRMNIPTLSGTRFTPPSSVLMKQWGRMLEGAYSEVILHGI